MDSKGSTEGRQACSSASPLWEECSSVYTSGSRGKYTTEQATEKDSMTQCPFLCGKWGYLERYADRQLHLYTAQLNTLKFKGSSQKK